MHGNQKGVWILAAAGAAAAALYFLARTSESGGGAGNGQSSGGGGLGSLASLWGRAYQGIGEALGLVAPRGIRNNNPGNLEFNQAIAWVGQVGQDADGYLIFDTPQNGARALGHDLRTAISEGFNTIATLIAHYAPPSENPTAAYEQEVASWGGLEVGSYVQPADATWIAAAVATQENGSGPWTAPDGTVYTAQDVESWAGAA